MNEFSIPGGYLKVSVCVVAYNQEAYIEKCLLSLINQKVDFGFEIIVGDDCSTDRTGEIIRNLAIQFPHLIKPIFHSCNVGPFDNYFAVHKMARGEYVAHVDGDDWCDTEKLRTQSLYLDNHPASVAVVHQLAKFDLQGRFLDGYLPDKFNYSNFDLTTLSMSHCAFGHSSLMYRKTALDVDRDLVQNNFIDFHIYVILASRGSISVVNKVLGAYTYGSGISHSKNLYLLVVDALAKAKQLGLPDDIYHRALARQYFIFSKRAMDDGYGDLFQSLISQSISEKIYSLQQVALFLCRKNLHVIKIAAKLFRLFKSIFTSN